MSVTKQVRVGQIEVTVLRDGHMVAPPQLFPDFDADRAERAAAQAGVAYTGGEFEIPINAFVVRNGDMLAVVDAGSPPGFAENAGAFPAALNAAGVNPDEVTHVALTHLHIDHVGGLVNGDGQPVFKNAELVSGQGDWAHFFSDDVFARANDRARNSINVSRRAVTPYADRRRELAGEAQIAPGMTMVPLPGHTPGHSGILIEDGDEQLLIWGDTIHTELFQTGEPDWSVMFDVDMDQARRTRKALFDRVAQDGLMIAGPHVRFPALAHLERAKTGFRLVPVG